MSFFLTGNKYASSSHVRSLFGNSRTTFTTSSPTVMFPTSPLRQKTSIIGPSPFYFVRFVPLVVVIGLSPQIRGTLGPRARFLLSRARRRGVDSPVFPLGCVV